MQDIEAFINKLESMECNDAQYVAMLRQEATALTNVIEDNNTLQQHKVFQRLCLPERIVEFKVLWQDDNQCPQVNRGWRVQHSNLVGPYKGGLRFHPGVNRSTLKALAFEQSFKNALTGLPIGGAKGGSDFDPKGKSDAEIARFCQSFMSELYRYIGPNRDIPAGDINVGAKEIGYMFGQYKRLTQHFEGAVTGKSDYFGGSQGRREATGFGVVYFLQHLLEQQKDSLQGKRICISGAGNVALHAALKATQENGRVVSLSNSRGVLEYSDGLSESQIQYLVEQQHQHENLLAMAAEKFSANYIEDEKPWTIDCDIALPCATQNELDVDDLKQLSESGCNIIVEGSNMALTDKALKAVKNMKMWFAPGKAANAGGVAISTLEMTQNATFSAMSFDEVDRQLHAIMQSIFQRCWDNAPTRDGLRDLHQGASIAAFKILADAMLAQEG